MKNYERTEVLEQIKRACRCYVFSIEEFAVFLNSNKFNMAHMTSHTENLYLLVQVIEQNFALLTEEDKNSLDYIGDFSTKAHTLYYENILNIGNFDRLSQCFDLINQHYKLAQLTYPRIVTDFYKLHRY